MPMQKLKMEYGSHATHLYVLVVVKGKEIRDEFDATFRDIQVKWSNCKYPRSEHFFHVLVGAVGLSSCEYENRIMRRIKSWPYQTLLSRVSGPEVRCVVRREACQRLIGARYKRLDVSTAKFRFIFWRELLRTAQFGTLHHNIYDVLLNAFADLPADMQLVESKNSIVSRITSLSPNIGDVLVSSRCTIKGDICSNYDGVVSSALILALDTYKSKAFHAIKNHTSRWTSAADANSFFPLCSARNWPIQHIERQCGIACCLRYLSRSLSPS